MHGLFYVEMQKLAMLPRFTRHLLRFAHHDTSTGIDRKRVLMDTHGRVHDYLRISLTERCNLRCQYCMPKEGVELTAREESLNLDEVARLTKLFVSQCGVRKIRLTGGEPTLDPKLIPLLQYFKELRQFGLKQVAMTTNGMSLRAKARQLRDLGLDGVNISLDTLREARFERITRRKGLHQALQGLEAALEVGFNNVKVNCVVMRDFNEDEILDFVKLASQMPIQVRFIEFMPFESNSWSTQRMVAFKEMLSLVIGQYPGLVPITGKETNENQVAKVFRQPDWLGSIGFITSMSNHFCGSCNRLRLTADGNFKNCLFGTRELSLRDLMRNGASDIELIEAVQRSLNQKWAHHPGSSKLSSNTARPMVKIGG